MDKKLFKAIDKTIRREQLYKQDKLSRTLIAVRFGVGRHHLNKLLNEFADGKSFPQYINAIRLEKAFELLTYHPEMSIGEVAFEVGFTPPNLRECFKRCYGLTPGEYRAGIFDEDV